MRLDRVFIDGFKNLKNVEMDFDKSRLTTVIIGENGAGKSNLIEAIADIFRFVDLNRGKPRYSFEIDYQIGTHSIRLTNRKGKPVIYADGKPVSRAAFERQKAELFPDLVFGYYSGGSRRLESLFDSHQRRYYDVIKHSDDSEECQQALTERRLFYCHPIHGVLALLSFFAFPEEAVTDLLREKLGITGFHSALAHFRAPSWFTGGKPIKLREAADLWKAKGLAGHCARALRDVSFHPLVLSDHPIDDYREKGREEIQFACFLRNFKTLSRFSENYKVKPSENYGRDMFSALEATDISDLFRDLYVWVTRENDESDDISFSDLSDGERQLLMVLGLIRIFRGKEALYLLDEPDTHLNPAWQHNYLDLIRDWTGITADPDKCHIIMNSHNPLTVAGLEKQEVRVMNVDIEGGVTVKEPFVDPKGLGFAGVLTDIFGLSSTLDRPTQVLIDERNQLARLEELSNLQLERLEDINSKLSTLGFRYPERDKLYNLFLRKLDEVELADVEPLTADEMKIREQNTKEIVEELLKEQ